VPGAVGQAPALGIATQHEAFIAGEAHGRPVGKREPLRSHPPPLDHGPGAPNHCGKRAEVGAVGLAAARPQGQRGTGSGGAEPLFLMLSASVLYSKTRTDPQLPAAAPKETLPFPGVTEQLTVPRPSHRSRNGRSGIES